MWRWHSFGFENIPCHAKTSLSFRRSCMAAWETRDRNHRSHALPASVTGVNEPSALPYGRAPAPAPAVSQNVPKSNRKSDSWLGPSSSFSDAMLAEAMFELVYKYCKDLQQRAVATQWQEDAATYRQTWQPLKAGDMTMYFGMSPGGCGFVGRVREVAERGYNAGKLQVEWETPEGVIEPCWEMPSECAPMPEEWCARHQSLPVEARIEGLRNILDHYHGATTSAGPRSGFVKPVIG